MCYSKKDIDQWDANGSPITAESDWPFMTWGSPAKKEEEPATRGSGIGFPGTELRCKHEWKTYTGLSEVFEYCKHCDIHKDQV